MLSTNFVAGAVHPKAATAKTASAKKRAGVLYLKNTSALFPAPQLVRKRPLESLGG
jgi:hypothetical protein